MDYAVEIQQLTKVFKDNKAVDDVSFSIKRGKLLRFLGRMERGRVRRCY